MNSSFADQIATHVPCALCLPPQPHGRAPTSFAPTHPPATGALQVCEFLDTHIIPQQPPAAAAAAPSQAAPASAPPPKVLLFAHHRSVMDRLHMFLQGYDVARDSDELRRARPAVGHVRIDGSTDHALRAELRQKFKDDPDCTVRAPRPPRMVRVRLQAPRLCGDSPYPHLTNFRAMLNQYLWAQIQIAAAHDGHPGWRSSFSSQRCPGTQGGVPCASTALQCHTCWVE